MRYKEMKQRVEFCIKHGDFTLTSGQKSDWICDLLMVRDIFPELMYELYGDTDKFSQVFGIETGGALLTTMWSKGKAGIIRKNGEIYPPQDFKIDWPRQLIDDVVSTEQTIQQSINYLNLDQPNYQEPVYIPPFSSFSQTTINVQEHFYIGAILDRRENPTLHIESLFTAKDFGL